MSKELRVNGDECIQCGMCVASFDKNFDFDPNTGKSIPISNEDIIEGMVDICPVGAISIEEVAEVIEFPNNNKEVQEDDKAA